MSRRLAALAARVRRLADALSGVRERVQAAVAAELGTAVGDAVRDLVRALARGAGTEWVGPARGVREWSDDPWDDEPDRVASDRWAEHDDLASDESPTPPVSRLAGAVAAAAAVARWWGGSAPGPLPWAAAALTALAGAAAWCGGPLAHAALAALAAAADLLAVGRPDSTSIP